MKQRNKAVPASYAILLQEGKLLLGLRTNTGYYDDYYALPAGHIEAGELPIGALIREAKEEIGIDIDPHDVRLAHTMFRDQHDETGQRVDYFFIVDRWSGEPTNCEPNKCSELGWYPLDALPKNLVHHTRRALECIAKGVIYSEIPFNPAWVNPNK